MKDRTKYNNTDEYYIFIFDRILDIAPVTGGAAAITFTLSRLNGMFPSVGVLQLICFDVVCLSYFVAAYLMKKHGIVTDGEIDPRSLQIMDVLLDALVMLQWNLISYIFPSREFWGFAPMFVLLTAFMFRRKAVLTEIAGISVSIGISWLINGDALLPVRDEMFMHNMSMRIVALVISFSVIYALVCFAERFTIVAKEQYAAIEHKNSNLESMGREVIEFTADIIEERDATSGLHVKRMKAYTEILAREVAADFPEYELTEKEIQYISLACVLHDVGEIGIPDAILQKPGRLTPEEFEVIKTHTTLGARMIDKLPDSVGRKYKRYCREICLCHHEKFDGNGYPAGLMGDEIPVSAQIVSVVDCYDALTNERPYKEALPGETAINMILNGECGVFSERMRYCLGACKEKLLNANMSEEQKSNNYMN